MSISRFGDGVPLNTKGQIVAHDGTSIISIPVGSDGQILTSQSSTSSGLVWANTSSGDTQYVSLIASATLTASSHSITFSNIPNTYDELILIANLRRGDSTDRSIGSMQINSNTTTVYRYAHYNHGGNTNSGAYGEAGTYFLYNIGGATFGQYEWHIPTYKTSTSGKVVFLLGGHVSSAGSGSGDPYQMTWGTWLSSDAITSITLYAGAPSATTTTFAASDPYFALLYGVNRS